MRCTASGRARTSSPSAAPLPVHRDGQPAAAVAGADASAVGAGSRHPPPRDRAWPDRVPLDQGHRPGRYRRPRLVPACAPGGQGHPTATAAHRAAGTHRTHTCLLGDWRALDRVTVCPWRIGTIVAATLVLTSMTRGRG